MRQIPHTHEALLEVPIGETIEWGHPKNMVKILAIELDNVLVEYPQGSNWGQFFIWSSGGGSGLSQAPLEVMKQKLHERAKQARAFYTERLSNPNRIVFNGNVYSDGGNESNPKNRSWLGFGGHKWLLLNLQTNQVLQTNNLWHGGKIPRELAVPDTHRSLTQEEYNELLTTGKATPQESCPPKKLPPLSFEQDQIVKS